MTRRILDTSILISYWNRRRKGRSIDDLAATEVFAWAADLAKLHATKLIVTPVVLEFMAGTTSATELRLARAFLQEFEILDDYKVVPADWEQAQVLAERVPRDGKPRQMGDCLIKAIANRYRGVVISSDKRFP